MLERGVADPAGQSQECIQLASPCACSVRPHRRRMLCSAFSCNCLHYLRCTWHNAPLSLGWMLHLLSRCLKLLPLLIVLVQMQALKPGCLVPGYALRELLAEMPALVGCSNPGAALANGGLVRLLRICDKLSRAGSSLVPWTTHHEPAEARIRFAA